MLLPYLDVLFIKIRKLLGRMGKGNLSPFQLLLSVFPKKIVLQGDGATMVQSIKVQVGEVWI